MKFLLRNWRWLISILISLVSVVLVVLNREWLWEAFQVALEAQPLWLLAAFCVVPLSFLVISHVLSVALRSVGYHLSLLHCWAIAIVAIIISQSIPAGGVGSYAFLVNTFTRSNVPPGEATLAASLEGITYITAMLIIFAISILYLAILGLAAGGASYIAGMVALVLLVATTFVLTRSAQRLTRWLTTLHEGVAGLLRQQWDKQWISRLVNGLMRGRELLKTRRLTYGWLVLVQLIGLCGHALAMLLVLVSLGTTVNYMVVLTAFGVALITSTFNVLPGGGGTVETAIVAVLVRLGVGEAAVPAAILFRLFNFWLMLPIAAACYHWLTHGTAPDARPRRRLSS
ncbi:MAG: flippase-like domain-containing protein [Chloroflexaceae bacterium]|nr:flippase-like domain-containing protein [Chloroflexaceae bacterium]